MRKTLTNAWLLLFVVSHVWAAQNQLQPPVQTVAKIQQVLRKAQEKDKAVNVKLIKKIGNQDRLSGKVDNISDTGFVVTDKKTGTTTKLEYGDVQKVSQKGMATGTKVAIIAGGATAAILGLCASQACWEAGNE